MYLFVLIHAEQFCTWIFILHFSLPSLLLNMHGLYLDHTSSPATSNPGDSHAPSTHITLIPHLPSFIIHLSQLFVTCECGVLNYWVMCRSLLQCAMAIAETHNYSKHGQWLSVYTHKVLLWQSCTHGSRNMNS